MFLFIVCCHCRIKHISAANRTHKQCCTPVEREISTISNSSLKNILRQVKSRVLGGEYTEMIKIDLFKT